MTTAHAVWWRRERTVQQPTSHGSGDGAVATEVRWSNRPFPHRGCRLEPEAVSCR